MDVHGKLLKIVTICRGDPFLSVFLVYLTFVLLAVPSVRADEFENARKALLKGVQNNNADRQERVLRRIAATEKPEAYDLIFSFSHFLTEKLSGRSLPAKQRSSLRSVRSTAAAELNEHASAAWVRKTLAPDRLRSAGEPYLQSIRRSQLIEKLSGTPSPEDARRIVRVLKALKKLFSRGRLLQKNQITRNRTSTQSREPDSTLYLSSLLRKQIVTALSDVPEGAGLDRVLKQGQTSDDWTVRSIIAGAVAARGDDQSRRAITSWLRQESDDRVLIELLKAVNRRRITSARSRVRTLLTRRSRYLKLAAVRALQNIGSSKAIEPLIDQLKSSRGRLAHLIGQVLSRLTGMSFRTDYELWREWWKKNRESFSVDDENGSKNPQDGTDSQSTSPSFYGIDIKSNRVLFCLDVSGSMGSNASSGNRLQKGLPEDPSRLDVAKNELKKAIKGLANAAYFNIIFFESDIDLWVSEKLVRATPEAKRRALTFIENQSSEGGTNAYDTLEKAFVLGQPERRGEIDQTADTIYFLSDGSPRRPEETTARVQVLNRYRQVKINTISIGSTLNRFMNNLAEQNYGTAIKTVEQ